MILKESRGIAAWRTWTIVPLIIVAGFAEGAGLIAFAHPSALVLAGLVILRGVRAWPVGFGFLLAMALLALSALWGFEYGIMIAGISVFATGWGMKFVLVTRAAYHQGFAIERSQTTLRPGWVQGKVRA